MDKDNINQYFVKLKTYQPRSNILAVNVGADDPMALKQEQALSFAKGIARNKGYFTLLEAEDDVRVYGQNHLAERTFFYKK